MNEIEELRDALDEAIKRNEALEAEIERLRAENIETLKTANRLTLALEAAEAALAVMEPTP